MSSSFTPLEPAEPAFDDSGTPYSPRYGDVYHTRWGALRQAESVFLRGNGLPQRWQGRRVFTVLETGFGLGMNFLALWAAWRADPVRSGRLHVVSIEAHPLRKADLAAMHARLVPQALRGLSQALIDAWPALLPGLHRLEFEGGALTLTLGFGHAQRLAGRIAASVDAYFLDGFAPARNPEMWQPELLAELAQLAAPGATAATWSSAGLVRRGLQAAGFAVRRVPGQGGKQHITTAVLADAGRAAVAPGWQAAEPGAQGRHALVVGAGPAGAGVAQSLALRGWRVTILDPALASGTAGVHAQHTAAAATPLVARDDNVRARLSRAGSARALARWLDLPGDTVRRCGTLQLARDAGRAADAASVLQALRFPESWVQLLDVQAAREKAGIAVTRGGLFFADGLLVRPPRLLAALLDAPAIERLTVAAASVAPAPGGGWRALDATGREVARAPVAVLANGAGAADLLAGAGFGATLPGLAAMHRLAGQVVLVPAQHVAGGPRCIVAGAGYLLPQVDGWCVAGSTYEHGAQVAQASGPGRRAVLEKVAGLCGLAADVPADDLPGWAGWRAVLPGRLPAVGPVPGAPGLWLACGYASRGLTWSALAGDVIGAALEGEPLPLERDLLAAIAPR